MKNWKRWLCLALLLVMAVTLTSCSSSDKADNAASTDAGKTEQFTWWMYKSIDATYYTNYNENPALRYLLEKPWGDNGTKVAIDFWVPPAGTSSDNYSNMIGSGDYADVIENTVGDTPLVNYQNGITLDLTELVKKYMPNYLAFLEANPDLKEKAVDIVDGEEKYLSIVAFYDESPDQFWGHLYRRDWLVKYGTNPVTGEAFSGGYTDENDPDSWEDNVVFPSGGSDPVYISDWEWMFEIFEKAYADLGIENGYCYSVPYNGYLAIGEVSASFGGACSGTFARTPENQIIFGPVTSQFRAYLECMNHWYEQGWLDPIFSERTGDMFYAIDTTNVYQGRVAMWYGLNSQVGGRMDNGDGLIKDICAYPAATPINDKYGDDENMFKEPYASYGISRESTKYLISVAAKDKDLGALLSMFDYLYTAEGSRLVSFGLNKEQNADRNDPIMAKFGMADGAYTIAEDGHIITCDAIKANIDMYGVSGCRQLPGLFREKDVDFGYKGVYAHTMKLWGEFENIGYIQGDLPSYLDSDQSKQMNKVATKISDYMNVHVPEFIMGEKDPSNDTDWDNWVKMMGKYGYQKVIDLLQPVADAHPYIPGAAEEAE